MWLSPEDTATQIMVKNAALIDNSRFMDTVGLSFTGDFEAVWRDGGDTKLIVFRQKTDGGPVEAAITLQSGDIAPDCQYTVTDALNPDIVYEYTSNNGSITISLPAMESVGGVHGILISKK